MSKSKKGFTLVEIMLVICIICLLLAVLIRGAGGYMDKGNVASSTVEQASATISDAFANKINHE